MKATRIINVSSIVLILFSAFSLLSVSLMAIASPQKVIDLVQVQLNNNDAFSSIRGVYGGVGLTIFITLIYLARKDATKGLAFLGLFWGFYALSRLMTILSEGQLGAFGTQWLTIESSLCVLSILLLVLRRGRKQTTIA